MLWPVSGNPLATGARTRSPPSRIPPAPCGLRSGGLGALTALVVLVVLFLHSPSPTPPETEQISDAELMNQVNVALSQDVPDAMTPLTKLVSWKEEQSKGTGGGSSAWNR